MKVETENIDPVIDITKLVTDITRVTTDITNHMMVTIVIKITEIVIGTIILLNIILKPSKIVAGRGREISIYIAIRHQVMKVGQGQMKIGQS